MLIPTTSRRSSSARISLRVREIASEVVGVVLVVALILGISGAKSLHLHVGHASVMLVSDDGGVALGTSCRSGGGCCHHAPPVSPDADPSEVPSEDGGDCDLCTLLAAMGSPVTITGSVEFDSKIVEYTQLTRCTTRDVWGPSLAISRGPPKVG